MSNHAVALDAPLLESEVGMLESEHEGDVAESLAWVAAVLEDRGRFDEMSRLKFQDFDEDTNGLLEWPECLALSKDLAATLGVPVPLDDKLQPAFTACAKSYGGEARSLSFPASCGVSCGLPWAISCKLWSTHSSGTPFSLPLDLAKA